MTEENEQKVKAHNDYIEMEKLKIMTDYDNQLTKLRKPHKPAATEEKTQQLKSLMSQVEHERKQVE